jgi:hypothetical protein
LGPLWQVWDEVAASEQHRVGIPFGQFETSLNGAGWRLVGEKQVHHYPVYHTAAIFLDRLQRRVWSRLWSMPDETIERGIAAVKAEIEQRGINLHEPVALTAHFTVRAYLPPDR